jgi:hypothetical protein
MVDPRWFILSSLSATLCSPLFCPRVFPFFPYLTKRSKIFKAKF